MGPVEATRMIIPMSIAKGKRSGVAINMAATSSTRFQRGRPMFSEALIHFTDRKATFCMAPHLFVCNHFQTNFVSSACGGAPCWMIKPQDHARKPS
jgi:hypothetical protein